MNASDGSLMEGNIDFNGRKQKLSLIKYLLFLLLKSLKDFEIEVEMRFLRLC
jgi:hypothetical protein